MLGDLWVEVYGVTYTPKVHSLLLHACDCQRRFGGLGDKTEHNIEKRHQEQKMMTHRLMRQGRDFKAKMTKQLEYEWRRRHPRVATIISDTAASFRKRRGHLLTLKEENNMVRKRIRTEERTAFVKKLLTEMEMEEDEGDVGEGINGGVINAGCVDMME